MSAVLDPGVAERPLMPPANLRFMAESEDAFFPICDHLCQNVLDRKVSLDADLLDIGCGYGRLAYGLRRAGFKGSYRGFDILSQQIGWLNRHFAGPDDGARYNFDFHNVHNARYNPSGLPFEDVAVPYAEASFDCVTSFSVFTHMFEDDIRQYLRRIHPLVRADGIWIATFFSLPDDFSLARQHPGVRYRLTEQVSDHCYLHNAAEPLHVIAYKETFLRQLFDEEGWEVAALQRGSWLRDPGDDEFQDWFVLRHKRAAKEAAPPACNICGGSDFGPDRKSVV